MASYILCQRKRNLPRIDVRICEQRCPQRDVCKEFRSFVASRDGAAAAEPLAAQETTS